MAKNMPSKNLSDMAEDLARSMIDRAGDTRHIRTLDRASVEAARCVLRIASNASQAPVPPSSSTRSLIESIEILTTALNTLKYSLEGELVK
jgi:hypothetical protein